MSRKQSTPPVGSIGACAESAHGTSQSIPDKACSELVTTRSSEAVGGVSQEVLPEWVRRRAHHPELAGSKLTPEPSDGFAEFLTVAELANVWRISIRTVRRRLAADQIPHIRVGRQVRIPREALFVGCVDN